ncbi:MAG: hypothetical protein M1823_006273 [Watsoniomyces obsoletus]|nr:MAG: hypothetical protein M1823_006273 [Watsoniomyces obsoletus]
MAALNWQTYDLGMQINDAMFAAGMDRTGYVLKPPELRPRTNPFDPSMQQHKERKVLKFSLTVLSAQQLPRPRESSSSNSGDQSINPYIELETICADDKAKGVAVGQGGLDASAKHGMSGIGSPHRRRTRIVQGNGYNPTFQDKFVVSVETKFPSLVFLRWTVWNSADGRNYGDKSGALASFTAKFDSLQEGYRHLPLFDHKGEQFLFATLFCRLQKEEVVTLSENDARSGKVESLKQFGRSMFRTLSVERKSSLDD